MSLVVYAQVFTVLGACLTVGLATIVGPDRLRERKPEYRSRLLDGAPHIAFLALVFLLNRLWRPLSAELSWAFGLRVTDTLYTVEGQFVAWLQNLANPGLTWVLSFVYVFGYGFLLVFPLVAYLFLDDLRTFRITALAYAFNYLVGLGCYTLFVAYGPRNYMPGEVSGLLYAVWPQIEFLTTEINANTNVFPSLHTSLSVTVAILAWETRESYPLWLYVAAPLAASVALSTMYLGFHWATDVAAGVVLGGLSVVLAERFAADETENSLITRTGRLLVTRTRLSMWRRRQ